MHPLPRPPAASSSRGVPTLIALAFLLCAGVHAQNAPPRDTAAAAPASGRIRGRVLAADTGLPLGRAQVTLGGPSLQPPRRVLTDAEGHFAFSGVPDGTFSVSASRTGYASLQYGQRRPYQPGTPVSVTNALTVEGIDIALPRGAVIVARVSDDLGGPIAGVRVSAQRFRYADDGQRTLVGVPPAGSSFTDDRGELRLFGLMPGDYVVRAEVLGMTATADAASEGFAPTFYPGVTSAAQATPIAVGIGAEATVQFSLVRSRLARVTGVVVDSQGRPANGARVWLATSVGFSPGANTGPDGRFVISAVPPDEYAVMILYDAIEEFATTLNVDGRDVSDLRLVIGPAMTVSGRVVFEGGAPPRGPDSAFRAVLASVDRPRSAGIVLPQRTAPISSDGRFGFTGISGRVIFDVVSPEGWIVKSVDIGGEDVANTPVDIGRRAGLSEVVITMTNRLTTIAGEVRDARGGPAADSAVVLVPADAYHPAVMARRVRVVRPAPDGTFTTRGVKPGRYVAVAIEVLEDGRQFSREFQQQVRRLGGEFTLREGESRMLMLRVLPGI
jgi:hypothetical protein